MNIIISEQSRTMNRIETNTDNETFRLATEAFRQNFPEQAEIKTLAWEPIDTAGLQPDLLIQLIVQGKEFRYYAIIMTNLTDAHRLLLLMNREKLNYPPLLITRYINPKKAEQLRQDEIEFIDTAGNTFINQPPLYVFIKGNRLPEIVAHLRIPQKRAFRPAGLKMIYAFLCNPGLENKNYREIAAAADVALGTVGWCIRELKETGFLLDMGKRGKRLTQKEDLLRRWITAYPEQLRPRQMLGRYKGDHGWWHTKELNRLTAQWGGELAAAKLTQYLQPQLITIYITAGYLNKFLLENKLKKDQAGDVEVLERFWLPDGDWQDGDTVHPILVHADLLATGNERNMETARIIYERYIVRLIRED